MAEAIQRAVDVCAVDAPNPMFGSTKVQPAQFNLGEPKRIRHSSMAPARVQRAKVNKSSIPAPR